MGVYARLRKSNGIKSKFKILEEIIDKIINSNIKDYSEYAENMIISNLVKQSFTQTEIKKLKRELNLKLIEKMRKVDEELKKTMSAYNYNIDVTDKHAKALTNYISNSFNSDINVVMQAINTQTNKALSVVNFAVNNIARQDVNLLYKATRGGNLKDNYKAFLNVFKSDYAQRYIQEIEKNPVLKGMIEQKGDIFKININGRNYDLDKYLKTKAKYQALDVIRSTETIRATEKKSFVYKFIRVEPAKEPRDHSSFEGQYFSDDPAIIGTKYKGQVVNSGSTISDFNLGGVPPFGCGHVYQAL